MEVVDLLGVIECDILVVLSPGAWLGGGGEDDGELLHRQGHHSGEDTHDVHRGLRGSV